MNICVFFLWNDTWKRLNSDLYDLKYFHITGGTPLLIQLKNEEKSAWTPRFGTVGVPRATEEYISTEQGGTHCVWRTARGVHVLRVFVNASRRLNAVVVEITGPRANLPRCCYGLNGLCRFASSDFCFVSLLSSIYRDIFQPVKSEKVNCINYLMGLFDIPDPRPE